MENKTIYMMTIISDKVIELKFDSVDDRKKVYDLITKTNENIKITFWQTWSNIYEAGL